MDTITIHAFDVQTDRILIARSRLHSMQRGKKAMSHMHDTKNDDNGE